MPLGTSLQATHTKYTVFGYFVWLLRLLDTLHITYGLWIYNLIDNKIVHKSYAFFCQMKTEKKHATYIFGSMLGPRGVANSLKQIKFWFDGCSATGAAGQSSKDGNGEVLQRVLKATFKLFFLLRKKTFKLLLSK